MNKEKIGRKYVFKYGTYTCNGEKKIPDRTCKGNKMIKRELDVVEKLRK